MGAMPLATIVSFRFGPTDGVSVVARTWGDALTGMGFEVAWVAGSFEPGWEGEGQTRTVPGMGIAGTGPPDAGALSDALDDADLVIVENLCSLPLNLPASRLVADLRSGLPTILHHHDPPWQRPQFAEVTELPPDDPTWRHVTINDLTRNQMAERGITATTIYNGFTSTPPPGNREATRSRLGVADDTILVAHPVRAIPRKAVDRAIGVTEAIGGTYWLTGPAEAHGHRPVPGDPRRCPTGGRRLCGIRSGGLPIHMGGLRQPSGRSCTPQAACCCRRLPGVR